jgi:hypothetical protein
MNCWDEWDIEAAAIRIVEAERQKLEAVPDDLAQLRAHAASCPRCGDILYEFLTLERLFREELAGLEGARWVPLIPAEEFASPDSPDFEDEGPGTFRLAAKTGGPADSEDRSGLSPIVYVASDPPVEISFQPGAAAGSHLAVLRRTLDQPESGTSPAADASCPVERIGLVCGARVAWFDDHGHLTWSGPISRRLVLIVA